MPLDAIDEGNYNSSDETLKPGAYWRPTQRDTSEYAEVWKSQSASVAIVWTCAHSAEIMRECWPPRRRLQRFNIVSTEQRNTPLVLCPSSSHKHAREPFSLSPIFIGYVLTFAASFRQSPNFVDAAPRDYNRNRSC